MASKNHLSGQIFSGAPCHSLYMEKEEAQGLNIYGIKGNDERPGQLVKSRVEVYR